MSKKISIPILHAVLIVGLLMALPAGGLAVAQWRYDLVDRAKDKIADLARPVLEPAGLSASSLPSRVPSLPSVFEEPGAVMNTLAAQRPFPTADDLAADPTDDQAFLQSILTTIFPEGVPSSEEEAAIEILRYVSTYLRLESNQGNATKILSEGYAQCGGMSVSFQALVRKAGLPARLANIFGVENQGGHTLAEVYYEGGWHLYDATFGVFFYSEPEYNRQGQVASFAELLASSTQGWYLFKAAASPWQGTYGPDARSFDIVEAEADYLADYYGYSFVEAYRQMYAVTFPVAVGDQQIISFPVVADLSAQDVLSIGGLDSDTADVANTTAVAETTGRTGFYYLGASPLEAVHTWFITARSAGFVRITYYSTEADPATLLVFPLREVHVVDAVQENGQAEFLLRISDREASVQFWAERGVFWVDAVKAEWLGETIGSIETP